MPDRLARYRSHDYPLPDEMLAWEMTGAGFESVGCKGKPCTVPVPAPGADELLCRVDAVGLCFSDVKLIMSGADHPRIKGRDLKKDPTRGGHEVALTVVAAGDNVKKDYPLGSRYICQADVYFKGRGMAFGYVIPGGMSEYVRITKEMLHGDEGSYLIPTGDALGYVEAALVEPWACVEAAYRIECRAGPRPGGRVLEVNLAPRESAQQLPSPGSRRVVLDGPSVEELEKLAGVSGSIFAKVDEQPGFDDVIVRNAGPGSAGLIAAAASALRRDGVLCLVGYSGLPRGVSLDVGRIHYQGVRIVAGRSIEEAYSANTRTELLAKGRAWFSGAAGPMGQMHVQRAIELEEPPEAVIVTDLSTERLDCTQRKLGPLAESRGVRLACLNPKSSSSPQFEEALEEAAGGAFDDVVVCAPVAPLVADAARLAAPGAVINIFAGLSIGTRAELDLSAVAEKRLRLAGSSGSRVEDMKTVMEKVEAGKLKTVMSLAAVGGMNQLLEGLRGLKANRFPGKTVIFPCVHDFPLTAAGELGRRLPEVAGKLADDGTWTRPAEDAFLGGLLSRA